MTSYDEFRAALADLGRSIDTLRAERDTAEARIQVLTEALNEIVMVGDSEDYGWWAVPIARAALAHTPTPERLEGA